MTGNRKARESKEIRSLDSLTLRALRLDPLYFRKYDHAMLLSYYRTELRRNYPTATMADIDEYIKGSLMSGSPYMRGWVAYSEGRMKDALENYDMALKNTKNPGGIRLERARVYALQGIIPSAIAEFRLALLDLRKVDDAKDEVVVFYNSKALIEHSIGVLFANLGQPDSARAALGRAITEDLSYFAAHVELGRLALTAKDTATATAELGLAAELAADEPFIQYLHGVTLLAAGQHAESVAPLKKAIELESAYAAPHFSLGQALEKTGDVAGARESYTRYLSMAARRDQGRDAALRRLDKLPKAGTP